MDDQPNTPSSDHLAMSAFWSMIESILGGAVTMRSKKEYLPQFPDEPEDRYDFRRKNAKFTNVYRDIAENLAQRPFAKQVTVKDEDISEDMIDFVDDVDGRSNNLHVFASEVFFAGINAAVDWILVDYTKDVPIDATRAQEAELGARPFWVRYPAKTVLAAYTDVVDGVEQFVHVRLQEKARSRTGFTEETADRVRVFDRELQADGSYAGATYSVYENRKTETKAKDSWVLVEGPLPVTIGVIPIVPFLTGRRIENSWRLHPPMRDAAELQIELYQQESGLKHIKELTAFPMLAGNGVDPPLDTSGKPEKVPVGPHSVLYAPPGQSGSHGAWDFIEPGAESLRFLADDIKETARELRELGRQPLTAQSGNLTVVTTAVAAQKGNSAIQAWALNLKDALERAFELTAMWFQTDDAVTVNIDTDFDLGWSDDDSFKHVLTLNNNGVISHRATIREAKRRSVLSADYDHEADQEFIEADMMSSGISDQI